MQNDLIKQSIADAKALRQSAYELAKEQIAETFGPRVQEMIKLKLSEVEDESMEEAKSHDDEDSMKEAKHDEKEPKMEAKHDEKDPMEEGEVDETTLDELLAELEADDKKKPMHEAEDDDDDDDKEPKEKADHDDSIEVEELKDIIRDVLMDVLGKNGGEEEILEPEVTDMPAGAEGGDDVTQLDGGEEDMNEITLDEILASLEEADKDHDSMEEAKHGEEEPVEEMKKMKDELNEAVKTIKTLRTELNEVNLLNAKLLYVNRIFKSKSLNEAQKLKVINAFDRAETVKEAKAVYETLQDSLGAAPAPKKSLKESVGFASKPAGMVPKAKPIVEQDDLVNRWQVLAGIKKVNQ
jgi:hypothetical protein